MSEDKIRFLIIMPWGRVGSNLIMRAVQQKSNQVFGHYNNKFSNETLNRILKKNEQKSHLEMFYDDDNFNVIGSKQNVRAMLEPNEVMEFLEGKDIFLIRMYRENFVKAAVSQIRAELYAAHTKETEGEPRWAVRNGSKPLEATEIDIDLLKKRIGEMHSAHSRLMDATDGYHERIDIEYEALNADPLSVIAMTFSELGFDNTPTQLAYSKATPDDLNSAISNFDEVAQALASSDQKMLYA